MHFHHQTFSSIHPGIRLLITGAVHGNETCGTEAIHRVIAQFATGEMSLKSGAVTFVPVTNPLAYRRGSREGDRNLNRRLQPVAQPLQFEDHIANWLCPLMQQHNVLLDLHSFRSEGQAFVMVGPENNQGQLEPFKFAAEEEALARVLGVSRFVDGWLNTYATGVGRRLVGKQEDATYEQSAREISFGMGTTEYMRSVGGYALTLECGQHQDPHSKLVAYRAIINTLSHLGLIEHGIVDIPSGRESLRLFEVVDKHHRDDTFSRPWQSFDEIKKGELIGIRHNGQHVLAEIDGRIIFPDANAGANEEWFYLAKRSERFTKTLGDG